MSPNNVKIWQVPPECAGQIVEVSYGDDGPLVWQRTYDQSDRTSTYAYADAYECCDNEWCSCFEPWAREPTAYNWIDYDDEDET